MPEGQPSFEEKIQAIRETLELVASMHLEAEKRHAKAEQEIAEIRATLRRAIRLAVQEARAERKRRKEADDRLSEEMTKLAAAQRMTEEALRRFIERGTNGRGLQP